MQEPAGYILRGRRTRRHFDMMMVAMVVMMPVLAVAQLIVRSRRSPIRRSRSRSAMMAPISGQEDYGVNTSAPQPFHHVDVFNRDRAAVAEENDPGSPIRLPLRPRQRLERDSANTWPTRSPRKTLKTQRRLMLTASRISSTRHQR